MRIHPLAGVVEKLRNADFHLRRLEATTRGYLNSAPAAIYGEADVSDSTRGRLLFKVTSEPPFEIAVIAGDTVA